MNVDLVLAPNPGPFTGPGTNTYVVGTADHAVVIDPGPVIESHLVAVVAAVGSRVVTAVAVTHTHPDHAPAAGRLADRLGAPTVGFAPGPEFEPNGRVGDGDTIDGVSFALDVVHTPGHTPDSVCFFGGGALFSGDHVMGGSTVIIDDLTDYLASLHRVRALGAEIIYPGHGPRIDDPARLIDEYISHRLEREQQILSSLADGARTVGEVVAEVYFDVDSSLHPAAALSVHAHLVKLAAEGRVHYEGGRAEWGARVTPTEAV